MNRQHGESLISVLVATVVLSLGLLGIADLQLHSTRNRFDAELRSRAVHRIDELAEILRANPAGRSRFLALASAGLGAGQVPHPGTSCSQQACDAATLAQLQLWRWEQRLMGREVQADGQAVGGLPLVIACLLAAGDDGYSLLMSWRGASRGSNPQDRRCGDLPSRYGTANQYRRQLATEVVLR